MPPVQITNLEQHLVLLAWLNRQFGYEHNRDLLARMKDSDEGFDAEGRSFVYHRLISRGDAMSISPDTLAEYDDNIRNHLHAINARRSEPITLRYFQYLAALYAEVFLDGYFNHRGETWRRYRDALGERGFTFEYSATFGQALTAARKDELTVEYGKAIVFDYSYRYFHGDGYGKDFRVLNLLDETTEEATETLLLGNLLSFYEQQCVFAEHAQALRPYHLERPLWVFVGSTVNAVYSKDRQKRSDMLTVARFLHRVLENKGGWVLSAIERLVKGESGLIAPDGQDVFVEKFAYLRAMEQPSDEIYQDILEKVFHAPAGGGLHLCAIRGVDGELGLKVSGAQSYFGLIYIGDISAFKNIVESDDAGLTLEEDALVGSLFDGINETHTKIEVLIGAKKFIEGWNSWRVSNMGLLNIGRSEGSEIIQIFGRGVRLRGKGASLKRSAALDGNHPDHIGLLETLNIFAVRANYMDQFRNYLEREGVETEAYRELPLFIRPNENLLQKGLVIPRVPDECDFATEEDIRLEPGQNVTVRVDMSLKVQALESDPTGLAGVGAHSGAEQSIPSKSLRLIDWEQAYLDLLEYKEQKSRDNLIVQPDVPRQIIADGDLYRLIAEDTVVRPQSIKDVDRLQEAATCILRKYVDAFYRVRRERWESEQMVYKPLDVKAYWIAECYQSLAEVEVFLLRNLSRGAGVGFFETSGFYPDFILWIKKERKQHIVFVEPHGMIHAKAYQHDNKARLHERLPELAKGIGARSQQQDVTLDSYIVSVTSYHDLHKRYDDGTWDKARFADAHILFAERNEQYDYIKRIFTDSISNF
ncbi:MAG: hypothetical protein F4Y91_10405 [Gemmatimonadetes bacterium]|nr:hypothetical protein [Gemmatimonadota bacterium]MYB69875.1 hypothetical protein [Gemmatimonadota bacterium]